MRSIATPLIAVILVFACQPMYSQQKQIALHHLGQATFFASLGDAYNAAVNGDTLYIPGGFFGSISLAKSLTLMGVGHNPDSTSSTGPTVLAGLVFNAGADNCFISGIRVDDIVSCDNAGGVVISRCNLCCGIYFGNTSISNWRISESWIGASNYPWMGSFFNNSSIVTFYCNLSFFSILNNVIQGKIAGSGPFPSSISYSEISNNIFLDNSVLGSDNSSFQNNIFVVNQINYISHSQFYFNLNTGVNGIVGNNIGSDNYLDNIPLETIFVNYSTGNTFYQNNFHVVNPVYLGNDGTPVGIYGGAYPWKEGSLPFNPHIKSRNISSATNPAGMLHINVNVNAQQH